MLVISDEDQLRALLRALVSAKFSPEPADRDVPASPLVARLSRDVVTVLREQDSTAETAEGADRWARWQTMVPTRPEWNVAVAFAAEAFARAWGAWSAEEISVVVDDLMAPFTLSEGDKRRLIAEVDARIRVHEGSSHADKPMK